MNLEYNDKKIWCLTLLFVVVFFSLLACLIVYAHRLYLECAFYKVSEMPWYCLPILTR